MSGDRFGWGIFGAGTIAHQFAHAIATAGLHLAAVGRGAGHARRRSLTITVPTSRTAPTRS